MICPYKSLESLRVRGSSGDFSVCAVARQVSIDELNAAIALGYIHKSLNGSPMNARGAGSPRYDCETDGETNQFEQICPIFDYLTTLK